jgi:alpha-L-arabinofuranosidase
MNKKKLMIGALIAGLFFSSVSAQQTIKVNINQHTSGIQPAMWGVFFEDINMGADGGIYAELIKNRSFEFSKPLMGWKVLGKPADEGDFLILNRGQEQTANPRFLRVILHNSDEKSIGLNNEGFRGMGIKKGLRYDFSVMCHNRSSEAIRMTLELVNDKGESIGGTILSVPATGNEWKKLTASFTATATVQKASLNIWLSGNGIIDLDMVSLFPGDTWKNRPGGMRADMIQLLADLKPGFLRFPGGCIVEGFDLSQRYQWKKTIGPIEERQLIVNRWNFEFPHRPTPDYFQTFGLGFYEYFQLSEDIGAEPLPILNCGMACQFNTAELVPMDQLDPYVQDALDLIEFANGDSNSKWGKVRTELGHPMPFKLKMLGVGNENWGPQYIERLKVFTKAIKTKYPEIKLINSGGTDPSGERFDYLNNELRKSNADIIDEHYYRRPEWFFTNAKRYDNYPRNGSKVFAGEYAAQSDKMVSIDNKNCWLTALSEAAFMTGLERNAAVVSMASYAPLFAHADGWQWTPDLIWVNNLQSYGTPDYYVQKLFSLNKGTTVVPVTINDEVVAGQDSLYAAASVDTLSNELIIKLVNASGKEKVNILSLEGVKETASQAKLTVLKSDHLYSMNSFVQPDKIVPKESMINIKGPKINLAASAYSVTIFRLKLL